MSAAPRRSLSKACRPSGGRFHSAAGSARRYTLVEHRKCWIVANFLATIIQASVKFILEIRLQTTGFADPGVMALVTRVQKSPFFTEEETPVAV